MFITRSKMSMIQKHVCVVKTNQICRTCVAKIDQHSIDIMKPNSMGYRQIDLLNDILVYFGINISDNDGRSTMICFNCLHKINTWNILKRNAESNQSVVDYLAQNKFKLNLDVMHYKSEKDD